MLLDLNDKDLSIINKYLINGVYIEVAPLISKINDQLNKLVSGFVIN